MELLVERTQLGYATDEGYNPLLLETNRGDIVGWLYNAEHAGAGVIYVGGVGGGFDTPADGLYPKLCVTLVSRGISGLRLQYRNPSDLQESVIDVLVGIAYLQTIGIHSLALVGHSFGGAVVIRAGALSEAVTTVVALATQSYGAEEAANLDGTSSLYIHGIMDEVLPSSCSVLVHKIAPEPKRLVLFEGADHGLHEKSDEVYSLTHEWLIDALTAKRVN